MTAKRVASSYGIEQQGFGDTGIQYWNLTPAALYEHAVRHREGHIAQGGALVCMTGIHTGRSPQDKFTVEDDTTRDTVDWGKFNKPISPEHFDKLRQLVREHVKGRELFIRDCYAGADPNYRLNVRVITEHAWHNIFAGNMFIRPPADDLAGFEPEFTVIQVPSCEADPELHGTRTGTFIVVSLEHRLVLIGGTEYAGEIKKSIFGVLNYLLPERGVMPMHCSANIGAKGDVAVFFGLSGTGKTTLSADPHRTLIGDDEHGWSENGVFNFEGGCYAKVVRLDALAEPEIYATTQRFGTILENVTMDPLTRVVDLDDAPITENTRASYPLDFIPNASETGMGGHPRNIIMLTADAFGVLPPISKLTPEQAMYHFLSGYTAKVAGTEDGVTEPEATFSTCFGAPFMPRHPTVYAKLLGDMMARHNVDCWLVNTGWSGGAYGTGERMKIGYTRAMVRAALNGDLAGVGTTADPVFGLHVPEACPDVPGEVLMPRLTWRSEKAYDNTAAELAQRFQRNFEQYETHVDAAVNRQAIHVAA